MLYEVVVFTKNFFLFFFCLYETDLISSISPCFSIFTRIKQTLSKTASCHFVSLFCHHPCEVQSPQDQPLSLLLMSSLIFLLYCLHHLNLQPFLHPSITKLVYVAVSFAHCDWFLLYPILCLVHVCNNTFNKSYLSCSFSTFTQPLHAVLMFHHHATSQLVHTHHTIYPSVRVVNTLSSVVDVLALWTFFYSLLTLTTKFFEHLFHSYLSSLDNRNDHLLLSCIYKFSKG